MDISADSLPRLAHLPQFRPPPTQLADPLPPGSRTSPPTAGTAEDPTAESPPYGNDGGHFGPDSPRPEARTTTATSGSRTSRLDDKTTAELVGLLLGLAVAGAAMFVRWRTARQGKLREPSDDQVDGVARPLARILTRHVPAALLNPDLVDAVTAGARLGEYLKDGPLVEPTYPDPGVPAHDPNEEI